MVLYISKCGTEIKNYGQFPIEHQKNYGYRTFARGMMGQGKVRLTVAADEMPYLIDILKTCLQGLSSRAASPSIKLFLI